MRRVLDAFSTIKQPEGFRNYFPGTIFNIIKKYLNFIESGKEEEFVSKSLGRFLETKTIKRHSGCFPSDAIVAR